MKVMEHVFNIAYRNQQRTWLLFLLLVFSVFPMQAQTNQEDRPEPPYSADEIRAWHKSFKEWPWLGSPEQTVSLRDDKSTQLLLAIDGYARGGTYILFARRKDQWVQISDEIEQAHHPIHVLKAVNGGWHDFEAFVPLWGSGGKEVMLSTYTWNRKKYVLKDEKEGMFCDFEPFKGNMKLCPPR
jgi:hypothetical protein